jgi:RimJ/RimL family protein N-acetyltransferase
MALVRSPLTRGFRIPCGDAVIREWTAADRAAFAALATNLQVMRYIGAGTPWKDVQIDEFIAHQQDSARRHGFCLGPLVEARTGRLIGQAGLQHIGATGDVEIGWWLAPDCWGRGLGSTVARAVLRFAFEAVLLPRVVAIAHPQNRASIRIMQRIGMMFRGLVLRSQLGLAGPDLEVVLYSDNRHQYLRRSREAARPADDSCPAPSSA